MRSALLVVLLASTLLVTGCNTEKKRLEGELAQSQSRVADLETTLVRSGVAADSLTAQLQQSERRNQQVRDSLSESLNAAVTKSQRLQASLQAARDQHRKSVDSLTQVKTTLEGTVSEQRTQIATLETQVTMTQSELEKVRGQRDELATFTDNLRPWHEYYKKEAGRNWAKKLFGAGRGTKPTHPEPVFQQRTAPDIEAQAP